MHVLLLYPPGPESQEQRPRDTHPSPGLTLLATILASQGHRAMALDLAHRPLAQAEEEVRAACQTLRPGLVGIGFMTFNRWGAYRFVSAIRAAGTGARIVLGGRHASFQWAQLLRRLPIDYVLCGEAERSLPILVECLASGGSPDGIPGLARLTDGAPSLRKGRLEVEDLNELPCPDYGLMQGSPLPAARGEQGPLGLGLMVQTSRGCQGRCAFCQNQTWSRGRMRRHSVGYVVDQIERQHDLLGQSFFSFADDTFGDDPEYARALAAGLMRRGLPIRWSASTRPDAPLDRALLRALRAAGLVCLHIGAESGSARVLRAMGKRFEAGQTERLFAACRSADIATRMLLIVGFPGETDRSLEQTAALLRRARPDDINLYPPILLPGTRLAQRALREGLLTEEDWMQPEPELLYTRDHDQEGLRAMREQVLEAFGAGPRREDRSRLLRARGLRERLRDALRTPGAFAPGVEMQRLVLDDRNRLKVVLAWRGRTLVLFIEDRVGAGQAFLTTDRLALSYQNDPHLQTDFLAALTRRLAERLRILETDPDQAG